MINYFLNLEQLRGHLNPNVNIEHKGTTGTLLSNILEKQSVEVQHPMFIKRYLEKC